MTYSNIATKKILSGHQSHGAGIGLGEDFPYLKYAWELYVRDTDGKGNMLITLPPLIAKTVELPRWSTDTQIVNVYNHKTIVQTKFNWEPITISFYDQVNKSAECLIWHFVKAQFDAPDGSKAPKHKDLDLEIRMKNLSSPGQFEDKVYKLKKAYIVDAQHDTLDYSTSDVVLWTVTIRYEELEFPDCDFNGPAPKAPTGMEKLPSPVSAPTEYRRTSRSSFTPQRTASVPPDARTEAGLPRGVAAGGLDTPAGGAYGNPTLLRQGERIRRNRQEQERRRREREAQNPPGPSIGDRIRNFFGWPSSSAPGSAAGVAAGRDAGIARRDAGGAPRSSIALPGSPSPSTGPNASPTSQQTSRPIQDGRILVDPNREPAPAPTRNGTDIGRTRPGDGRGITAASQQVSLEEKHRLGSGLTPGEQQAVQRLRSQGIDVQTGEAARAQAEALRAYTAGRPAVT